MIYSTIKKVDFMKNYKSQLLKIFIPIMLSNLISQIQMLIDRIFLGRVDILYMSAVGNATAPVWTTMSFVFSLSLGSSILMSQAIGSCNNELAKKYAGSLLKFHSIIPVLLFLFWIFLSPLVYKLMGVGPGVIDYCVTYTRYYAPVFLIIGLGSSFMVICQTSNFTRPLISYGLIRSILNVFLDYVLIFGKLGFPEMGIAGAALATTIAEYVGFIYIIILMIFTKKNYSTLPSFKTVFVSKISLYLKSVKLGVNSALEDLLWNFGNLMIIRILNTIDEKAAGIYSMVFTLEVIAVVIIGALGNATLTVSGEATGAKDLPLYRKVCGTSFFWSSCVSLFFLIIVCIFPRQTLSLFTTDKEIIEVSVVFIILVAFNLFGKAGNIIMGSGIRGYGDTGWMLFTQVLGTIGVISMASLFVFVFKLGMIGVFIAVMTDEYIRAIINTIRFRKIKY